MRDPGEILPTVYVLEDRKLPDGEWATCDSHDLYETIEGAEDTAKEWREMEYDDGEKYDVRIAEYRRAGIAGEVKKPHAKKKKKEETISRGELELAGIPVKLERFMELSESVIELAEDGAFGPVFETCEADCDCTICELRVALGRPRGHDGD